MAYRSGSFPFQSAPGTGAPGDPLDQAGRQATRHVSIRSRDRSPGRPLYGKFAQGLAKFQSAPGTGAPGDGPVGRPYWSFTQFQSAPGTGAPGDASRRASASSSSFQSAPGTGAPGDLRVGLRDDEVLRVSIRSRDRSPGRLGGRDRRDAHAVSIRSRDRSPGRPPEGVAAQEANPVSIRSRDRSPGRPRHDPHAIHVRVSIRSRDRSPGRRDDCEHSECWAKGFNPLPGPEPRETRRRPQYYGLIPVSIRSRDRSPGRQLQLTESVQTIWFQSAPGTGAPGDAVLVRLPDGDAVSIRSRDRSPGRHV